MSALAVTLGTGAAVGGVFITLMSLGSGVGGLVPGPCVARGEVIARRATILLILFGVMVLPIRRRRTSVWSWTWPRTYFVNNRGDEVMGSTWSYLDLTAFGRQEDWEDSPDGYPQTPPYEWWNWHDEYGDAKQSKQWRSQAERGVQSFQNDGVSPKKNIWSLLIQMAMNSRPPSLRQSRGVCHAK